jgi:hypothetical protein
VAFTTFFSALCRNAVWLTPKIFSDRAPVTLLWKSEGISNRLKFRLAKRTRVAARTDLGQTGCAPPKKRENALVLELKESTKEIRLGLW